MGGVWLGRVFPGANYGRLGPNVKLSVRILWKNPKVEIEKGNRVL